MQSVDGLAKVKGCECAFEDVAVSGHMKRMESQMDLCSKKTMLSLLLSEKPTLLATTGDALVLCWFRDGDV